MDMSARALNPGSPAFSREFKDYCGRERVILRRRRLKLRLEQFHIIAQVGQGGYGEVFLARKHVCAGFTLQFCRMKLWPQDSGEVCALKRMRKKTLFKMDEVGRCNYY
jgi:serine/threonine protein kinase